MKTIDNTTKVFDATKKMRKLIDEIAARGGFIAGNIELIEDAVAEIDELLNNDEIMNNKVLSKVIMEYAVSYKRLRANYARLTT